VVQYTAEVSVVRVSAGTEAAQPDAAVAVVNAKVEDEAIFTAAGALFNAPVFDETSADADMCSDEFEDGSFQGRASGPVCHPLSIEQQVLLVFLPPTVL